MRKEKFMQSIMLDLTGLELTPEEKEFLQHPQVGGIILFARNYQNPNQLEGLLQNIRQLTRDAHLLIAVDQEGGRVQRFREGFTRLPPLAAIGNLYAKDPQHAEQLAAMAGWLMAIELLAFDLDFSFAPILDLNKGISRILGGEKNIQIAFRKDDYFQDLSENMNQLIKKMD